MPEPHVPLPAEQLEALRVALAARLGGPVTLDRLTGDYVLFQRRRGHRTSTDDLLTAWYAVTHAPTPTPQRLLDLGSGIGSVGLSVLWCFPTATLAAVEVQPQSHALLSANVAANGLGARVRIALGDLRASGTLAEVGVPSDGFDVVTGSPPYFPPGTGIVSADGQRAAARFELHGDVGDYCRAARGVLAEGGRFVFCFPFVQRPRAEAACAQAGLRIVTSRDVIPRAGLPALFSLFACEVGTGAVPPPEAPFVVRDATGTQTAEHTAARARLGLV